MELEFFPSSIKYTVCKIAKQLFLYKKNVNKVNLKKLFYNAKNIL